MPYRIEVSRENDVVILYAEGCFDLSFGFALWQYCRPEEGRYRHYFISLARVTDLRDSGLAWLQMFVRWARGAGVTVRIMDGTPAHRERCINAGLPLYSPADLHFNPAGSDATIAIPLPAMQTSVRVNGHRF